MNDNKKNFLEVYRKTLGVITPACNKMHISRSTFYKWLELDDEFKEAVRMVKEEAIDFVESLLFKQMQNGDTTAMIFYLKTIGKKRGYVEKYGPDIVVNTIQLVSKKTEEASEKLKEAEQGIKELPKGEITKSN